MSASHDPDLGKPVRLEDMLWAVAGEKRRRIAVRQMMKDEGALREAVVDRRIEVLEKLHEFLGYCLTCRREVNEAIAPARIRPPRQPEVVAAPDVEAGS